MTRWPCVCWLCQWASGHSVSFLPSKLRGLWLLPRKDCLLLNTPALAARTTWPDGYGQLRIAQFHLWRLPGLDRNDPDRSSRMRRMKPGSPPSRCTSGFPAMTRPKSGTTEHPRKRKSRPGVRPRTAYFLYRGRDRPTRRGIQLSTLRLQHSYALCKGFFSKHRHTIPCMALAAAFFARNRLHGPTPAASLLARAIARPCGPGRRSPPRRYRRGRPAFAHHPATRPRAGHSPPYSPGHRRRGPASCRRG